MSVNGKLSKKCISSLWLGVLFLAAIAACQSPQQPTSEPTSENTPKLKIKDSIDLTTTSSPVLEASPQTRSAPLPSIKIKASPSINQPTPESINTPLSPQSKQDQVSQNTTDLQPILEQQGLLTQAIRWKAKILITQVENLESASSLRTYTYQSSYQDSNNNQKQDAADVGFFNPASTVKVGISALVLEKLTELGLGREAKYRIIGSQTWYSLAEDIKKALIISDNEASNRLILFLGFETISQKMRQKGLSFYTVGRLMLDRGVAVASPPFEIEFQGNITRQSAQAAPTQAPPCLESQGKIGNCATAGDLTGILRRLVEPDRFSSGDGFNLRADDRAWMQSLMAKTPREAGFNLENTFCRFLDPTGKKLASRGQLLSKCGIGLFNHSFVDTSFLQTDEGKKFYIVFAVNPPRSVSKSAVVSWMNRSVAIVLNNL